VAAVLAFSFLAQLPTEAKNLNNCGVKGYGYHDHGKVCPNRPFPGHGVGLGKFGITAITGETKTSVGHGKNASVIATSSSTDNDSAQTVVDVDNVSSSKGHGHGKGHAWGHVRE